MKSKEQALIERAEALLKLPQSERPQHVDDALLTRIITAMQRKIDNNETLVIPEHIRIVAGVGRIEEN